MLPELPVERLAVRDGVRLKFFTSATSAARSAESGAGGGPGRNWLAEASTKGFHRTSSIPTGSLPFQRPGPTGTVPAHFVAVELERTRSPAPRRPGPARARRAHRSG